MKRLIYILPLMLLCACGTSTKSAMTSKVLLDAVDTTTPLSIVYFYEYNGERFVEVTSDAPYIFDRPVIGYETYKHRRETNYVVYMAQTEDFEIPSSILNVSQLHPRDSVLEQLKKSLWVTFGWGTVYVYKIAGDSLVYDHMDIIE